MREILISIKPKYVELIASGKKTIEVRKTRPKIDRPFKCYIYETQGAPETPWVDEDGHFIFKGRGEVIGEFVCDRMDKYILTLCDGDNYHRIEDYYSPLREACLTQDEIVGYGNGKTLYGWHISDLKIYDKPKELSEFTPICKYKDERCWNCVCYEEAFGGCCRVLSRPPQSWCYVKENENEQ